MSKAADATKDAASAVGQDTNQMATGAYHATASGTKKAANATADAVKQAAQKTKEKMGEAADATKTAIEKPSAGKPKQ
jgi:hypothetical protein